MNISGVGTVPLLPFKTVIRYIVSGVMGWLFTAAAFIWALPHLAAGEYRVPAVLVLVHLMVLGWATMLAQGAIYQLIPVAFLVGVPNVKLTSWNYWLYTAGTAGLIASFAKYSVSGLRFFGSLTVMAVLLFVISVIRSLLQVKERGTIFGFVLSSMVYLGLTVIMGITMVDSIATGKFLALLPALLTIHMWVGLIGWFTMLIVGFSYKLFPMFTLAHGFSEQRQKWILLLFNLAILMTAAGALLQISPLRIAGTIALLAAVLLYGIDVAGIYKHRMRGRLETPMLMSVIAIGWLAILAITVLVVQLLGIRLADSWITVLGLLYFLGWLSQTIVGYLYKIAPFLIWNHRYSHKVGREPVPLLKDMVDEKLAAWVLGMYNAGMLLAGVGVGIGLSAAAYTGAVLILLAVLVFVYQMAKVILPPKQI